MRLKPREQMTPAERKGMVTAAAQWCAERRYRLDNPTATAAAARRYAGRCWRQYVDMACDILALWYALDEAEAAAPKN